MTDEQKCVRVLASQGRPRGELWRFNEAECDQLAALCDDDGELVEDADRKFVEIVAARNRRNKPRVPLRVVPAPTDEPEDEEDK